ncbi:MAG: GTPase Era [Acidobacteriota bacterium]
MSEAMMMMPRGKVGSVALVGRPNAGKSTLMNRCLEEKLAIVSDKPQTTRHRIVGILSSNQNQMVFYDTPGLHKPQHRLNQQMLRHTTEALRDADVVCLLVDVMETFGSGDRWVLDLLSSLDTRLVVALNKIDRIAKPNLLPIMARYSELGDFEEIVPISALTGDGVEILLDALWRLLPEGEVFYDPELLTTHPERFFVSERIREKILAETRDELPFASAVAIEKWEEPQEGSGGEGALRLHAVILVERPGQKKILVGKGGRMIRRIGTMARLDLEEYLGRPVYLELYVRLQPGWRENQKLLAALEPEMVSFNDE